MRKNEIRFDVFFAKPFQNIVRNFPPLVYVENAKISVYAEAPHLFNIFFFWECTVRVGLKKFKESREVVLLTHSLSEELPFIQMHLSQMSWAMLKQVLIVYRLKSVEAI